MVYHRYQHALLKYKTLQITRRGYNVWIHPSGVVAVLELVKSDSVGNYGIYPLLQAKLWLHLRKNTFLLSFSRGKRLIHPLNPLFTLLPSGRRYRTLSCRRTRFGRSVIPSAISLLNNLSCWPCIDLLFLLLMYFFYVSIILCSVYYPCACNRLWKPISPTGR